MKWINALFLIFLCSFLGACNLVEQAEKREIRKLTKSGFEQYTFVNDTLKVNGYYGGNPKGKVVVLIHGFGGDAQLSWNQTLRDLSEDYFLIATDLLWFGKSFSSGPGNLQSQIDALHLYLNVVTKNLNHEKYTVVGHSYGGFVALGTYFQYSDQIDKIVIIDSPGITYNTELLDTLAKDAGVEDFKQLFVLEKPEHIDRLNKMAFSDPPKVPKTVRKSVWKKYFALHHSKLNSLLATLPSVQEKYLSIEVKEFPKTLIIWGEEDKVFPVSEGEKLRDYMKAEWFLMPGVGHSAPFENYPSFLNRIKTFLES